MTAFTIHPDDAGWGRAHPYEIWATHACSLPGVTCPVCTSWSGTGVIYPTIDCSVFSAIAQTLCSFGKGATTSFLGSVAGPIPIEDLKLLVGKVRSIVGPDLFMGPGTEMGPLRGRDRGTGKIGDFTWINPWNVLVQSEICRKLENEGIHLEGAGAQITGRKGARVELFEIEARPVVQMRDDPPSTICSICGRRSGGPKLEDVVLDKESYDPSIPLQRVSGFETILVASEQFVNAILKLKLTDVISRKIPLA